MDHALLELAHTGVALLLLMRMLRSLLHALATVAERRRRRVWPSALGPAGATPVLVVSAELCVALGASSSAADAG